MAIRGVVFDHIACGIKKVKHAYPSIKRLGGVPRKGGDDGAFRGGQFSFKNGGALEVIEPLQEIENFLHRFITRNGEGIHHVTFVVPSLAAAIKRAQELGLNVVSISDKKEHWKEAFIHPKSSMNLVTQLAEWNPRLAKEKGIGWDISWNGYKDYNDLPTPNDLLPVEGLKGLQMTIHRSNWSKAHKLFVELLGAEVVQCGDKESFSWRPSPMTIDVEYEYSNKKEGPTAIKLDMQRDAYKGEETFFVPSLGANFVAVLNPPVPKL